MKHVLALIACLLLGSGSASAHIGISPQEVVIGKQYYELLVPNEKNIATTEVRLVAPAGVTIVAVEQMPGWQNNTDAQIVTDTHTTQAAIHEVRWTGGQILANSYAKFGLEAEYAGATGTLQWQAYQTYADGTVVAWDGSSASASAPTVRVVEQTQEDKLQNSTQLTNRDRQKVEQLTWVAVLGLVFGLSSLLLLVKQLRSS